MEPVTVALFIIFISCLTLSILFLWNKRRGKRLPPGPKGLPIIGSMLSIPPRDYLYFEELKQQYGDLTLVKIGTLDFLYLNTPKAMREALLNQKDTFSGRLHSEYGDELTGRSGIIFRDGPEWSEHRRFTLKTLRDLGLGRSETEDKALIEFYQLLTNIPVQEPVEVFRLFVRSTNNMIAQLAFGERCGTDDPEFEEFQNKMGELFNRGQSITSILPLLFPSLMKIPVLNQLIENHTGMKALVNYAHAYMRKKIDEHESKLTDVGQEPENVCDALLLEKMRKDAANIKDHTFTYQQIIRDLVELFIAGTDTTAVTLTWATFLLATNIEVQEKVQKEIDSVLESGRAVSMEDRRDMPFVNATIDEILRVSTIVPTGLPHRCRQDTELFGYFVPKDMVVMTNLYSIHRDPNSWEKPYDFYPKHFLSEDGSYKPSDNLMPFSLGRRACIGEGFAKMELFIFFVSIFQHYNVRLADEEADTESIMAGVGGSQRRLLPHELIFQLRT